MFPVVKFREIHNTKISEIIDSYCLNQLIDEPTHISNSLSCIDFIITEQPNLFVDFGVDPSLYPKSHHQIAFGTINFSVPRPPHINEPFGNMIKLK